MSVSQPIQIMYFTCKIVRENSYRTVLLTDGKRKYHPEKGGNIQCHCCLKTQCVLAV